MSTKKSTPKKTNKKYNKRTTSSARSVAKVRAKGKKCAAPNRFIGMITLIIIGAAACVAIAMIAIFSTININNKINPSDASRFAAEYSSVSDDNVFVYATSQEVIDLIEHGTGAVYLGFPSCPWCQAYASYLNAAAKEAGLDKVYYYNIQEDRQNNSEVYQTLVSLLAPNLQYDEDGARRIYVPDVVFVVNGRVIGNDLESSKDTAGTNDPAAYWTEERVAALKDRLKSYAQQVVSAGCTDSCNN